MKIITSIFLLIVAGPVLADVDKPLFHSAATDIWGQSFTSRMNEMQVPIETEISKFENSCIQIKGGSCYGVGTTVNKEGQKIKNFSGMCTVTGNLCDINTDHIWQIMVEGSEMQFSFAKVVQIYEEL